MSGSKSRGRGNATDKDARATAPGSLHAHAGIDRTQAFVIIATEDLIHHSGLGVFDRHANFIYQQFERGRYRADAEREFRSHLDAA